jgi:hypothetical protein
MKLDLIIERITLMDTAVQGKGVMLSSPVKKRKSQLAISIERRSIIGSFNL